MCVCVLSIIKNHRITHTHTHTHTRACAKDGITNVTGSIDMAGNTLFNVSNPVNPQDVVTKDIVDNRSNNG